MATTRKPSQENREATAVALQPSIHRRILRFLNEATRPQDLISEKILTHDEGMPIHEDNPEELNTKPRRILDHAIAKELRQRIPLWFS